MLMSPGSGGILSSRKNTRFREYLMPATLPCLANGAAVFTSTTSSPSLFSRRPNHQSPPPWHSYTSPQTTRSNSASRRFPTLPTNSKTSARPSTSSLRPRLTPCQPAPTARPDRTHPRSKTTLHAPVQPSYSPCPCPQTTSMTRNLAASSSSVTSSPRRTPYARRRAGRRPFPQGDRALRNGRVRRIQSGERGVPVAVWCLLLVASRAGKGPGRSCWRGSGGYDRGLARSPGTYIGLENKSRI